MDPHGSIPSYDHLKVNSTPYENSWIYDYVNVESSFHFYEDADIEKENVAPTTAVESELHQWLDIGKTNKTKSSDGAIPANLNGTSTTTGANHGTSRKLESFDTLFKRFKENLKTRRQTTTSQVLPEQPAGHQSPGYAPSNAIPSREESKAQELSPLTWRPLQRVRKGITEEARTSIIPDLVATRSNVAEKIRGGSQKELKINRKKRKVLSFTDRVEQLKNKIVNREPKTVTNSTHSSEENARKKKPRKYTKKIQDPNKEAKLVNELNQAGLSLGNLWPSSFNHDSQAASSMSMQINSSSSLTQRFTRPEFSEPIATHKSLSWYASQPNDKTHSQWEMPTYNYTIGSNTCEDEEVKYQSTDTLPSFNNMFSNWRSELVVRVETVADEVVNNAQPKYWAL